MTARIYLLCMLAACGRYTGDAAKRCIPEATWSIEASGVFSAQRWGDGFIGTAGSDLWTIDPTGTVATVSVPASNPRRLRVAADDIGGVVVVTDDQLFAFDPSLQEKFHIDGFVFEGGFDVGAGGEIVYTAASGLRYLEPDGSERWHDTSALLTTGKMARIIDGGDLISIQSLGWQRASGLDGTFTYVPTLDRIEAAFIARSGVTALARQAGNDFSVEVAMLDANGNLLWAHGFDLNPTGITGIAIAPSGDVIVGGLGNENATLLGKSIDGFAVLRLDGTTGELLDVQPNCAARALLAATDDGYLATTPGGVTPSLALYPW